MRRFAVFATVLLVVVIAGSQPWKANSSKESWCVCLPSRAGLMLKSFTNRAATSTATITRTASTVQGIVYQHRVAFEDSSLSERASLSAREQRMSSLDTWPIVKIC